ncbi:MAG: hypothetical protein Ta2A_20140 [Treponemataceae bacterium]|nr:MAG: hypothetical protein Ta2A_20140 [Treponemataceae bacterium]
MNNVNTLVQTIILAVIIAAAVAFLAVRIVKALRGKGGCACGCENCKLKKS